MEGLREIKLIFALLSILLCMEVILLYIPWQENIQLVSNNGTINRKFWEDRMYLWRPFSINYSNVPSDYIFNDRIVDQFEWTKTLFESENQEKLPVKNILLVFGVPGTQFWETNNKISCPGFFFNEMKCKLTKYIKNRPMSVENFDAVMYTYTPYGDFGKLPDHVKEFKYATESPLHAPDKLNENTLWVSYYRGSDIVIPYSKWLSFKDKKAKIFNTTEKEDKSLASKDFSIGKPNFAVTFISHCSAPSNRDEYIDQLQKYVSVDVFGACGTNIVCNGESKFSCLQKVVKKYKFYLAFENSNCRDYITEKLFKNSFMNDVLPVVMGAHPDDYSAIAPPNSYIHIQDFQSPKELAEYLTVLDKNDTLYNEYFKWKGTGFFYDSFKDLFCRVCGMLFYYDHVVPIHKWGADSTWASVGKCLPESQWYWNRRLKT